MADKKLKGIMVFYLNMYPDLGQDLTTWLMMFKDMNKPLMERLARDGNYVCLMVPTTKEATRVEKIDYDAPFPRYMPQSVDVNRQGLGKDVVVKKTNVFKGLEEEPEEEEALMKGFITLFVNFHPDVKLDPAEVLKLVQKMNEDALTKIIADGQYQVMIVPTTKEAARAEKVDYNMPFPRLSPKAVSKTKTGVVTPKIPVVEDEDEEDEGPYDEVDDEELEEEGKE